MYPNLPYPSEVYVPFDIFTAEEVTRIDANIKSLAAGTGFNTGGIPTTAIANGAITGAKTTGIWWEEVGRSTAASPSTVLSASITPKKFLKIIVTAEQAVTGASNVVTLRFNNDAGATQYARAIAVFTNSYGFVTTDVNGITGVTNTAGNGIFMELTGTGKVITGSSNQSFLTQITTSADSRFGIFRWKSSADITNVSITNSLASGFATGSSIVVLGHD